MSDDGHMGAGDCGRKGIELFFSRHTCGAYCDRRWLKPAPPEKKENKSSVVQKGTKMILGNKERGARGLKGVIRGFTGGLRKIFG